MSKDYDGYRSVDEQSLMEKHQSMDRASIDKHTSMDKYSTDKTCRWIFLITNYPLTATCQCEDKMTESQKV